MPFIDGRWTCSLLLTDVLLPIGISSQRAIAVATLPKALWIETGSTVPITAKRLLSTKEWPNRKQ